MVPTSSTLLELNSSGTQEIKLPWARSSSIEKEKFIFVQTGQTEVALSYSGYITKQKHKQMSCLLCCIVEKFSDLHHLKMAHSNPEQKHLPCNFLIFWVLKQQRPLYLRLLKWKYGSAYNPTMDWNVQEWKPQAKWNNQRVSTSVKQGSFYVCNCHSWGD